MKKIALISFALFSLLACGGGNNPPADSGQQMDTGTASDAGPTGPTCAAPGFVCCIAGSTTPQQPSCENDMPVCPESNPPAVRTPGTTCGSTQSDASTD